MMIYTNKFHGQRIISEDLLAWNILLLVVIENLEINYLVIAALIFKHWTHIFQKGFKKIVVAPMLPIWTWFLF